MRSISTQEGKVLSGGRLNTPVRLRVRDPGGTLRDLTALFGRDFVRRWDVDEDVDQPVAQLTCSLAREVYFDSLSYLRTDSRANLLTGSYAPLISAGAEVFLDVAILPEGIAAQSSDWRTIFNGEIDHIDLASNPMSITCRDIGCRLQDLQIEADKEFGSGVGVAMETVMQQIIDYAHGPTFVASATYSAASGTTPGDRVTPSTHNGYWYRVTTGGAAGAEPVWPTTIGNTVTSGAVTFTCAGYSPTLYVPTSPSFLITTYPQQPQSVLEAIRSMALNVIGWDVRYKWRSATSQFELTLYVPDRAASSSLYTWDADHYFAVPNFAIDRSTVRTKVSVVYSDGADLDAAGVPKRKTTTRQDKDSMNKWSNPAGGTSGGLPLFCQLAEDATSQIDTATEAGNLAAAALADLKDPKAEAAYDLVLFPFGELGDLYTFSADGVLYNADQTYAVTGIRHSGDAGGATRTTVRVRGKPVVAVEQWLRIEAGEIVPSRFVGPEAPTGVAVAQVQGGLSVTWVRPTAGTPAADFEVHASTSSGFTPSSSTLKATTNGTGKTISNLTPGVTYYVKVVPRDRDGNRGTTSSQVNTGAGYTPPRAMTPLAVYNQVLFNPSFEIQSDSAAPPDAWTVAAGTWGSGLSMEASTVFMGGQSVHFHGASKQLRSQLFPLPPYPFQVRAVVRTASSGVAYVGLEIYDSSLSLVVSGGNTLTSDGAWAPLAAFTVGSGTAAYAAVVVGSHSSNPSGGDVYVDGVEVILSGQGWSVPSPYGTGWSATVGTPGYRLDEGGRVWLRGKVQQGTNVANTTVFTLPAFYRIGSAQTFACAYQGGGTVWVDVNTNGTIVVSSAFALNNWISLAGVSFLAEG